MLVSGVQQSDSVFRFFFFHYSLSQDIECRFLCYTVGLCRLYVLRVSANSCFIPPPPSTLVISLFSTSVSLFLFHKYVHL